MTESTVGKTYYVYILASRKYGALYIGVTGDIAGRLYLHREEVLPGHTAKYHIHRLVHFEAYSDLNAAILREKQWKKWLRAWKIALIEAANPDWNDLYPEMAWG